MSQGPSEACKGGRTIRLFRMASMKMCCLARGDAGERRSTDTSGQESEQNRGMAAQHGPDALSHPAVTPDAVIFARYGTQQKRLG
jgi:hypothetical protein